MPIDQFPVFNHGHIIGAAALHAELIPPGCNVGMTRQESLTVHRFLNRDLAQTVQTSRKTGRKARRHVLGDHDRGRVRGQARQYFLDRLGATGRGTNGDQLFG